MTFSEYQEKAIATLTVEKNLETYLTLGLVGEAGEIAEKVKKLSATSRATLPNSTVTI